MSSSSPQQGFTYITDNGLTLCHSHLGAMARMTGRDLSGQPIARITVADMLEMRREFPDLPTMGACEMCGARPER